MNTMNAIQEFIGSLCDRKLYERERQPYNNVVDIKNVYNEVVSSKFRKTSVDQETTNDILTKIERCLQIKAPLKFSVPFGAYKSWRLNLNFRPDWAEVFNMSYLLEYAAEICKVYPYGVEITYTFSNNIMYFVSDYPRDSAQEYVRDFGKLLAIFNSVLPQVKFVLKEINTLYPSQEEYYIDFLKNFLDNLVFWDTKYSLDVRKRHLKSARHNLNLFGERNIGQMPSDIQEKYFYYSALMTDAIDCLKERRKFNKDQDKIQLIGVRGPKKSINIGACATSTVHFWVGRGCLKYNKGKLKSFVYTYSNLESIYKNNQFLEYNVDSIFKSVSDNFSKILFIEEEN